MFRIVKRAELSKKKAIAIRAAAIVLALVAAAVFIFALGRNPVDVYLSMLKGAFGSSYRFREIIIKAIPLTITSLGIAIAFKMKFWNIGAEGQIFMGAFAASLFALHFRDMQKPLMLLIMAAAGIIAGGLWALIPAFFKAQFGTNETLFTLMMNYIALKWVTYLQYGPWKDPASFGFPKVANFSDNAILPKVFGIHIGWIITLILIAAVYVFINRTKKGYEISVIGESENTARYAGMNVRKIILTAIFISGGICGLTGMIQASAVNNTLAVEVTGGVGFTAIITAWLGQLSAPIIFIVSFLFAALLQGGAYIQSAFQIPQAAAQIIQGTILFFVLGSEFFIQYRLVFKNEHPLKTKKEGA
ncbi:MAG: ABC transporter permease [Clostridiales bacterium]|nr:ABC transporter permease [Eubacteriales bacterium]MDH7566557.1 ABC transporter permease [Clostridiales bacterium]